MDCLPNIEHVIKMADSFSKTMKMDHASWNKDQKPDFYLGMFAAMRIFQSSVLRLQKDWATTESEKERLDHLSMECAGRCGEIAMIIMDKYQLDFLKQ